MVSNSIKNWWNYTKLIDNDERGHYSYNATSNKTFPILRVSIILRTWVILRRIRETLEHSSQVKLIDREANKVVDLLAKVAHHKD